MEINKVQINAVGKVVLAVLETIQEAEQEGPVPETPIYMALQKAFPNVFSTTDNFYKLINGMVAAGLIKHGPNHTLETVK